MAKRPARRPYMTRRPIKYTKAKTPCTCGKRVRHTVAANRTPAGHNCPHRQRCLFPAYRLHGWRSLDEHPSIHPCPTCKADFEAGRLPAPSRAAD